MTIFYDYIEMREEEQWSDDDYQQVALWLVSPVSLVEVPTVLVKLRSETCVDQVACSRLQRSGGSGIRRSISDRSMSIG